ncbi:MAG: hypothetical protein FWB74_07025 [Defluviitaleaceae bacterium]|nr:hypothetical protein [Defluviitaleaceae bacterium]
MDNIGKRIMILGSAGSSKSTLAVRLGEITCLPVTHLDRLFWNPGWVQTPKDEFEERANAAAAAETWIIDGNYSRTLDYRLERADCVIFLDFSRYFCLFRVLKRRFKNHGKTRFDLAEGCPERLDREFLLWVWNYPKRARGRTLEWLEQARGDKNVYHFRKRKDVKKFLQSIFSATSSCGAQPQRACQNVN